MDVKDIKLGKKYYYNGKWLTVVKEPKSNYDKTDHIVKCVIEGTENSDYVDEEYGCETINVYASELRESYTTVAELIEQLSKFDPNMGVDLMIFSNDSKIISKNRFNERMKYGTSLDIDEDCGCIKISNKYCEDYELE